VFFLRRAINQQSPCSFAVILINEGSVVDAYIIGFGKDEEGEVYVLSSESAGSSGTSGAVHRIAVPTARPGEMWTLR
jgi:hypothetical protein